MHIHNKIKSGFTLVELLIVIAIIGILSGIILPQINEARKKAEYTKFYADIHGFYEAIHIYMTNKTSFPTNSDCQDSDYLHSLIQNMNGTVEYSAVNLITQAPGWCVYQMPTSSTPQSNHVLSLLSSENLFTRNLNIPVGTQVWYGTMTQSYLAALDETIKCGSQVVSPGKPYLWGFVSASSTKYLPPERDKFIEVENWTNTEYPMENSFCFYID